MASQLGEPTTAERAVMVRHHLGYPCLTERHALCGRRLIVDLNASPDDWHDCTCPCHRETTQREGPMANQRAAVRDAGAHPSVLDALARKGSGPSGSIWRPRNPYADPPRGDKRGDKRGGAR